MNVNRTSPAQTAANKPRRVHFIGICGVGMSAVAIALHQKGWKVTGSDAGFFPPVSTRLTEVGLPYYAGWHPEKMVADGRPDFVVVGNAIATQNPELLYAREHDIPVKSYPETLGEFFVKPGSIVVAGTYGKTTSSALLSHILKHAGWKPAYMSGGLLQDGSDAAVIGDGEWSVMEGDEYTTAKWDQRPKFAHYRPTHLLLTAVVWDHADIYKTEAAYFDAFRELIRSVPKLGHSLIVACLDQPTAPKLLDEETRGFVSYGASQYASYHHHDVNESPAGLTFKIDHDDMTHEVRSPLLGNYNAENITGCYAMAFEIGIPSEIILKAISTFTGLKRRLEKRLDGTAADSKHGITIIDDIAHSPEKSRSVLKTLRAIYSGTITAVYEPNIGNRTPESIPSYADAFANADRVIIPHLSKLKVDVNDPNKTFNGDKLAEVIAQTHKNALYIDNDAKLVETLASNTKKGDVIAFLGSHGFRGMIEETIERLKK